MPKIRANPSGHLYFCGMSASVEISLNDKHLRLWGIPVSVTVLLSVQMLFYFPNRWDLWWRYMVISLVYTSLLWEAARWLLVRIRRRYPRLDQTKARARTIFVTFACLVAIGQWIVVYLVKILGLYPTGSVSLWVTWVINFSSSLFFVALIGGIYEAQFFFAHYKQALQKAEHLQKQQAKQRLETLKNRVNPHFLFNALTTLSALIGEDAPRAERFVNELSKVYRYLLRAGRESVALLRDELAFVEAYVFLLRTRFEEGAFSMTLPPEDSLRSFDRSRYLPALSLQHALDYLVRTQHAPLHLHMTLDEAGVTLSCADQPKSLSFDLPALDRGPLEHHGAVVGRAEGTLTIKIPFTPLPIATT